jgi:hypothetical protein
VTVSNPLGWMHRIARHALIDHYRRARLPVAAAVLNGPHAARRGSEARADAGSRRLHAQRSTGTPPRLGADIVVVFPALQFTTLRRSSCLLIGSPRLPGTGWLGES